MAITRGNATTAVSANSTSKSITITAPTCSTGDILILGIVAGTSDADMDTYTTWPTGFTQGGRSYVASSGHQLAWAWKAAASGDSGAALTASWDDAAVTASAIAAVCMAFAGAASPVAGRYGTRSVSSVATIDTPALDIALPSGCVDILLGSVAAGATQSFDVAIESGCTEHAQAATAITTNVTIALATVDGTVSGTEADDWARTWTWSGAKNGGAATIILAPTDATFATAAAAADAAGGAGSFVGSAEMGGVSTWSNPATWSSPQMWDGTTGAAEAAAAGGSSTFAGGGVFVSVAGAAVAAGGTGSMSVSAFVASRGTTLFLGMGWARRHPR